MLLLGKERAGLERAVITNTLAASKFRHGAYRKFSALVSEQDTLFHKFRIMASKEDRDFFNEKMADPAVAEVQRIRDILFNSGYASSLYVLLGQLYQNMALRGAYHSIKNLIIRGAWYGYKDEISNPKKQQHYQAQFSKNYQAIKQIVKKILALPETEISPAQRRDVEIVWANIKAYHKSVEIIIALQNQGKHIHEIDGDRERGVKIDDLPADLAIRRLVKSTKVGEFGVEPKSWFNIITQKINRLKEVENHLASRIMVKSAVLKKEAKWDFISYLLFNVVIVLISLVFGVLMVWNLKNKTQAIIKHNKLVISGDFSVRIKLPNERARDELDQIAESMNYMVESLETTTELNQQTMRELQVSESQVRSVLDTAPDGIFALETDGTITSINVAGENLFGYYPGDLIGKHISLLIPTLPAANEKQNQSWHTQWLKDNHVTNHNIEVDGICQDSGSFPVEISLSSYIAKDDRLHFTLIIKDITERKQAKAALTRAYNELEQRVKERTQELEKTNVKLSEEIGERVRAEQGLKLASKVFETATEGILITDENASIIKTNEAFTEITGFSSDELLGSNPAILSSGRHDAAFFEKMWDSIKGQGSWTGEIWNRRNNGEIYPQRLSITSVWNSQNKLTNYVGIFSDITHIKQTEERLEKMAYFDALTELPNRLLFQDRLEHALTRKSRHNFKLTVMFLDLDRFKHVNDSLGHSAGDQLLVEVAGRISACLRTSDTVARLGGDEFAAIVTELKSGQEAIPIARKIIESLQQVFILNGHDVFIGASIGISVFPKDGEDREILTKRADIAMYKAKESGRGNFKFYEEGVNIGVENHVKMESQLRNGLVKNEFAVYYQPKVSLESGSISGSESLIRWFPNQGKMVSPGEFIPLAEETGIILALGKFVLQQSCHQVLAWQQMGYPMRVAVNLSPLQFQKENLLAIIKDTLASTQLAPESLELEITESMVMGNVEKSIDRMKALKELGLTIAVDDFGTGYSSLNYLKQFPIDTLKIDQSFVRSLSEDRDDIAIVLAIISLGKALNLRLVAEGVETREQLQILQDKGCHDIQGYYFSKPLTAENMQKLLEEGRTLQSMLT